VFAFFRYGPGPHKVQFTVQHVNSKAQDSFLVEMAPIKWMPHSVHMFLEQVSHGLWNNSVFQVNREHVIQAGPSTKEHRQHFREYELDRLAFPEYAEEYPHKKWTLGFAGRPGGPSWYINKLDNTEDHGPFGQEHHALDEYADSCFAKVIGGFDILEKVFEQEVGERTPIISAIILGWEDHWTDEDDEDWHNAHEEYSDDDYFEDDDWFDGDSEDDHNHGKVNHKSRDDAATPLVNQVEILADGSTGSYVFKERVAVAASQTKSESGKDHKDKEHRNELLQQMMG